MQTKMFIYYFNNLQVYHRREKIYISEREREREFFKHKTKKYLFYNKKKSGKKSKA